MTAHRFAGDYQRAIVNNYFNLPDPGDAGEVWPQIRNPLNLGLISAGAETRKLFPPTAEGLEITIYCDTYVGDIVISNRNQADDGLLAIDQSANNTITFGAAGDSIRLKSFKIGSDYRWRVQGVPNGAVLSTV